MFGIGFPELLLILALLLISFKPSQLAELVRTAGTVIKRLGKTGQSLKEEFERELGSVGRWDDWPDRNQMMGVTKPPRDPEETRDAPPAK